MSKGVPATTGFGDAAKTGLIGGVSTVAAATVATVALGAAATMLGGPVGTVVGLALAKPVAAVVAAVGTIGTGVAMANTVANKREEYKEAHSQIQTAGIQFEGRAQGAPMLAAGRG